MHCLFTLQVLVKWWQQGYWNILDFPDAVALSFAVPIVGGLEWVVAFNAALLVHASTELAAVWRHGGHYASLLSSCFKLPAVDWAVMADTAQRIHTACGASTASILARASPTAA